MSQHCDTSTSTISLAESTVTNIFTGALHFLLFWPINVQDSLVFDQEINDCFWLLFKKILKLLGGSALREAAAYLRKMMVFPNRILPVVVPSFPVTWVFAPHQLVRWSGFLYTNRQLILATQSMFRVFLCQLVPSFRPSTSILRSIDHYHNFWSLVCRKNIVTRVDIFFEFDCMKFPEVLYE